MIAEKIESVINRIQEFQHLVTPSHWGILSCCVAELEDAAGLAFDLESLCAVAPGPLLQVIDFTRITEDGKTGVNLTAVADVMEDLTKALRDADIDTRTPPPLRLIPCDGLGAQ